MGEALPHIHKGKLVSSTDENVFADPEPTPCMKAFDKWWKNNANHYSRLGAESAWAIFRSGYWAGEDSTEEIE